MNHQHNRLRAARAMHDLLGQKFVIFDTETTGFDHDDEIIQAGIIDQDGRVLLDTCIRPECPITNTQYHGISDEMVKDAPAFPQVYAHIRSLLENRIVVAYNADYDLRMLDQVCRRHDLEPIIPLQSECVMERYAEFYGAWSDWHQSYTWQKLHKAVHDFGLEFPGEEHHAVTDCQASLMVMRAMAAWWEHETAKADIETDERSR